MAGVKGRSGGTRPGAGRKPKPPGFKASAPVGFIAVAMTGESLAMDADPVGFLTSVMNGELIPSTQQLTAAITLAKLKANPAGGKKEQRTEAAAALSTGRFGARPPPLKVVGRGA